MADPIREEPTTARRDYPPQPLRPVDEGRLYYPDTGNARDLVHWGPVWAGVFIPIGLLLLLAPLGVGLGLGGGTGAAVWGFIMLIVSFFVGGYVVGRTLNYEDSLLAGAHGLLSWAVALSFLVLATLFLGIVGAAGAANAAAGAANAAGVRSLGGLSLPAQLVNGASWGTFIALLVSAVLSIVGAMAGNAARPAIRRAP